MAGTSQRSSTVQSAIPLANEDPNPLQYRRIVVKAGTAILTEAAGSDGSGGVNLTVLGSIVRQLCQLREQGAEVMLVTSGAIAAGRAALGRHGPVFPRHPLPAGGRRRGAEPADADLPGAVRPAWRHRCPGPADHRRPFQPPVLPERPQHSPGTAGVGSGGRCSTKTTWWPSTKSAQCSATTTGCRHWWPTWWTPTCC